MEPKRICPSCQKPLATDVPMGLCPECLVKAGFPSGAETDTGATRPIFTPPPIEELAKNFPQLEIIELIGRGGMGAVYKARQPKLNRIVALKILPPAISNKPAFAERFTREAQALAQLNNPGIVTLYEFGEASGLFYFLMEYVDGVTLRHLLQAGRVSPREALAIVPQICDALQYAHDQGIVHRDIKPENILLDRRGRVKVADFGLAKIVENQGEEKPAGRETLPSAFTLTDVTKVIGTPQYMSPEQITAPGEVDHRADIYALGVVFYQMLTGELPDKNLQPPSKKVQLDVRLDEVVLRALEEKPELRYQQASILKTHLETIASTFDTRSGQEREPGIIVSKDSLSSPSNQEPPPPPPPPLPSASGNGKNRFIPPAIGLILAGVITVFGMLGAGVFMGLAAYRVNHYAEARAASARAHSQAAQAELDQRNKARTALQAQLDDLAKDTSPEANEKRRQYQQRVEMMAAEIHKAETQLALSREEERAAKLLLPRVKWGALVYVGPMAILAGLLSGALTITGAVKMLRQRRSWAFAASILGMITPPGFVLGVPFGIWALVLLLQRLEPNPHTTNTSLRNQLLPPAIGLILSGMLTIFAMLASGAFIGIAAFQYKKHAEHMTAEYSAMAQAEETSLDQLKKRYAALQPQPDAPTKDTNEFAGMRQKLAEEIDQREKTLAQVRERQRELRPFSLKRTWGPTLFYSAPISVLMGFISGILTVLGAIQMLRQHRRWGVAASILGMITPPGFLLGLPFGIWALVVLSQKKSNAQPAATNELACR